MNESTFIFLIWLCGILFIFTLLTIIVEGVIKYREYKKHLTIQNKVIKLETLIIKGK